MSHNGESRFHNPTLTERHSLRRQDAVTTTGDFLLLRTSSMCQHSKDFLMGMWIISTSHSRKALAMRAGSDPRRLLFREQSVKASLHHAPHRPADETPSRMLHHLGLSRRLRDPRLIVCYASCPRMQAFSSIDVSPYISSASLTHCVPLACLSFLVHPCAGTPLDRRSA